MGPNIRNVFSPAGSVFPWRCGNQNGVTRELLINEVSTFGDSEAKRINGQLTSLSYTMDSRIGADVSQVNDLLSRINSLNGDIVRAKLNYKFQ